MEFLMRGTLDAPAVPSVVSCARALSLPGPEEEFREHEQVYAAPPDLKTSGTPLRLRRLLSGPRRPEEPSWTTHTIKYTGTHDPRCPAPCVKRTAMEVHLDSSPGPFLATIEWKKKFEFVRRGRRFRTRSGLTIEVYTLEKLRNPGDPSSAARFLGAGAAMDTDGGQDDDDDDQVQWIVEVRTLSTPQKPTQPDDLLSVIRCFEPHVTVVPQPSRRAGARSTH